MRTEPKLTLKLPDELQRSVAALTNDICHQFSRLSAAISSTAATVKRHLPSTLSPIWDVYKPLLALRRGDWEECKNGVRTLNILNPIANDYEVTNNSDKWESADNPRAYIRTAVRHQKARQLGQWNHRLTKKEKNWELFYPGRHDLQASSESLPDHALMSEGNPESSRRRQTLRQ